MSFANKLGIIVILIVVAFGTFCCIDLGREFNIKSQIIGYFYTEPEVVKINDFEYDINALIFSNTGTENQYYASANAKPVSNFDNTKQYTITINGIPANKATNNNGYIDCDFTNKFLSTKSEEILTDTLNIKINFYKEGTKIVFITNNGEQAVKLWSSYIAKNGFSLKIVEDNFNATIKADNLKTYTLNLYYDNEIYQTINFNTFKDFELPQIIDNKKVNSWVDINNTIYTKSTIPFENINLYAVVEIDNFSLSCNNDNILTIKHDAYGAFRYNSEKMNITKTQDIDFFNRLYLEETDFDCSIKITDFYGYNFTIGKENMTYKGNSLVGGNWYDKVLVFETDILEEVGCIFNLHYDSENDIAEFEFVISFDNDELYPELFPMFNEDSLNNEMNFTVTLDLSIY